MIVCTECGHHNGDEEQFCGSCRVFLGFSGERIVEEEPAVEPAAQVDEQPGDATGADPAAGGLVRRVKELVGLDEAASAPSDQASAMGDPAPTPTPGEQTAVERAAQARASATAAEQARRDAEAKAAAEAQAAEHARVEARKAEQARRRAQRKARTEAAAAERLQQELATAEQARLEAEQRLERERQAVESARAEADTVAQARGRAESEQAARLAADAEQARREAEEHLRREREAAEAARAEAEQAEQTRREAEQRAQAEAELARQARAQVEAAEQARKQAEAQAAAEAEAAEQARRAAALLAAPASPSVSPPAPEPPAHGSTPRPLRPEEAGSADGRPRKPGAVEPAEEPDATAVGARSPEAVRPAAPKQRRAPKTETPTRTLKAGDLICGRCGVDNPPTRNFCRRCAASLEDAGEVAPRTWRERLLRRSPKIYAAGERPMRKGAAGAVAGHAANAGRSRARRTLGRVARFSAVGALLVGLVGVGASPLRGNIVSWVTQRADAVRRLIQPPETDTVTPTRAEASTWLAEHPPAHAIDLTEGTWWAEGAEGEGVGQWLRVHFDRAVDIHVVGFWSGRDDEDWIMNPRPEELRLLFSNGTIIDLTLKNQQDWQYYDVHGAEGVTSVEVRVEKVYPGQATQHMALSDVAFQTQRRQ